MEQHVYSVLGLGFGPANLSLAIALEEFGYGGSTRFLERADRFQWQREQLLPGADIQNNPFRDLITATNPNSRHTFINYLASRGELTSYLHLNAKFPLRLEYGNYMAWTAESFRDVVDYGQPATHVSVADIDGRDLFRAETADGGRYLGESLVLGVGRSPRVPPAFSEHSGTSVFHSSAYVSSMRRLEDREGLRVTVVGSSQSAIEIVLDLLGRPNVAQVTSLHRGIGFRLKDTSPYSRQAFLPEFVDYFYPLPKEVKRRLREQLKSVNYAACDQDVIDQLSVRQHEDELTGADRLRVTPFSEVRDIASGQDHDGYRMTVRDVNNRSLSTVDTDVVVLATGFRDFGTGEGDQPYHPMLEGIADRLERDDDGLPVVARDYSIRVRGTHGTLRLYLNGLCEPSHGLGDAGALAVLPARAADIAQSMMVETADSADGAWPRQSAPSVIG
jgi:L-ornithine N5-oxygenase